MACFKHFNKVRLRSVLTRSFINSGYTVNRSLFDSLRMSSRLQGLKQGCLQMSKMRLDMPGLRSHEDFEEVSDGKAAQFRECLSQMANSRVYDGVDLQGR